MYPYSCTGEGHSGNKTCCIVDRKPCPHLLHNEGGRRYACALMVEHGDWDVVIDDPRYQEIGQFWESRNQPFDYCRSFDPAFCCRPEFRNGRRHENHIPTPDDYFIPKELR